MFDLYDRLFPADTPQAVQRWRRFIGLCVLILFGLSALVGWAFKPGLPGLGQVAFAQDVKHEVAVQVAPISKKVDVLEKTLAEQTTVSKVLLAKVAEDQILFLTRRRCRSKEEEERIYLSSEINKYLNEYRAARGFDYRVPSCDELSYREGATGR